MDSTSAEKKLALRRALAAGELSIGQATLKMRRIAGMTQFDYATRVLKISPRILADIEKDRGNPRLDTLKKIGRPFGFDVGFIRRPKREMPREELLKQPPNDLSHDVRSLAEKVIGDPEKADRWLRRRRKKFNNRSAIEIICTPKGLQQVKDLLSQIDSGYSI